MAVVPELDHKGMIVFREEQLTDPATLFEDEETDVQIDGAYSMAIWGSEKESLPKDSVISYGLKRESCKDDKHFTHMEYKIERDELEEYPGLLHKIKLAMVKRADSGSNDKNSDYMERLNAIPELAQIISNCRSQRLKKKRRKPQAVAASKVSRQKKQHRVTFKVPEKVDPLTPGAIPEPTPKPTTTPTIHLIVIPPPHEDKPPPVSWRRGTSKEVPGMPDATYRY